MSPSYAGLADASRTAIRQQLRAFYRDFQSPVLGYEATVVDLLYIRDPAAMGRPPDACSELALLQSKSALAAFPEERPGFNLRELLRGQATSGSADTSASKVLMDPTLMKEAGMVVVAEPFSLFGDCTIDYNARIAAK